MTDVSCGCRVMETPCAAEATQEDLLCDPCREFADADSGKSHFTLTGGGAHRSFTGQLVEMGGPTLTRAGRSIGHDR